MMPSIHWFSAHPDYPQAVTLTVATTVGLLMISLLVDCTKRCSHTFSCTFPSEKTSHVTAKDIQHMTERLFGYRHVSSPTQQKKELNEGMQMGCALSLRNGLEKSSHWDAFPGESEENRVFTPEGYEAALNGFIDLSLTFDLQTHTVTLGTTTIGNVVNRLARTRFSLLDYTHEPAAPVVSDREKWFGLGRIPKTYLAGKHITAIPAPTLEEMGISPADQSRILKTPGETQRLFNCLIAHHRTNLLAQIRTLQTLGTS